jgi:hypothetical protein
MKKGSIKKNQHRRLSENVRWGKILKKKSHFSPKMSSFLVLICQNKAKIGHFFPFENNHFYSRAASWQKVFVNRNFREF